MASKQLPFTEKEWKIPGYTGYVQGINETYKKTPVMSQLETKAPDQDSFIFTRTQIQPKSDPTRDPCNFPDSVKKPEPGNLWPSLQETAIQDSFKPPRSNIALGDQRMDPFKTSYGSDFHAPFQASAKIRSPMRNKDLAQTTTALTEHYASAYNRVGDSRLQKMISTMRERLESKLGNSNNNAFKMRRLFKMYDEGNTGRIHFEDFRMMGESFGMQLDDDSLLALYHVYDPEGTGFLAYEELVKQLLDPDYYALYVGNVDNTQAKVDKKEADAMMTSFISKFSPNMEGLSTVFRSFDLAQNGYVTRKDFLVACASIGVLLNAKEMTYLASVTETNSQGEIHYPAFCTLFS